MSSRSGLSGGMTSEPLRVQPHSAALEEVHTSKLMCVGVCVCGVCEVCVGVCVGVCVVCVWCVCVCVRCV